MWIVAKTRKMDERKRKEIPIATTHHHSQRYRAERFAQCRDQQSFASFVAMKCTRTTNADMIFGFFWIFVIMVCLLFEVRVKQVLGTSALHVMLKSTEERRTSKQCHKFCIHHMRRYHKLKSIFGLSQFAENSMNDVHSPGGCARTRDTTNKGSDTSPRLSVPSPTMLRVLGWIECSRTHSRPTHQAWRIEIYGKWDLSLFLFLFFDILIASFARAIEWVSEWLSLYIILIR